MNTITLLLNQLTVSLQSFTIDSFLAIGLVYYITSKLVGYAYSITSRLFWLFLSFFIFYKVAVFSYPIISVQFFSALGMFFTVLPVIRDIYRKFATFKQKVTYIAPDAPTYQPKFGLTPEQMELRKNEDKREQEKHNKKQEYLSKLSKKLDNF